MTRMSSKDECLASLTRAGIDYPDAIELRRIAMALHRWHELECGDSNDHSSWAIERDETTDKPYLLRSFHHTGGTHREPPQELAITLICDAALYILRPGDVPAGERADAFYSRGLAVYK